MRVKISHRTSYNYDSPVQYGLQQVRLKPGNRADRTIHHWNLDIEGGRRELGFQDQHGNLVDLIQIDPGHDQVVLLCDGEVDTRDNAGVVGPHDGPAPLWLFNRSTPLTQPGPRLHKLVRALDAEGDDPISRLHALSRLILEKVAYKTDQTHSETTAEDAIELGSGVCQDHAHIFIAAARILGFPARYVSGYLLMPGMAEQEASHAWAEVHLDGIGWVGFDVSNGISPDDHYVAIATGLDYKEAAPISGLRFGNAIESMEVNLRVEQ